MAINRMATLPPFFEEGFSFTAQMSRQCHGAHASRVQCSASSRNTVLTSRFADLVRRLIHPA